MSAVPARLPTFYLTHGGGPMPLLGDPSHAKILEHWAKLREEIAETMKPQLKAILVVSAHWENDKGPAVTSWNGPQPLLFDYYGFAPETYKYKYEAPGDPRLAQRVVSLLRERGFEAREDSERGFDHGVFVPLLKIAPDADVPVVAMSLISSLDPEAHFEVGRALAPLRDEGVLIIASGSSFHSMTAMRSATTGRSQGVSEAQEFDAWLRSAVLAPSPAERQQELEQWALAPSGRFSHPREEHLVPLFVAAGAAPEGKASVDAAADMMGFRMSSFRFE